MADNRRERIRLQQRTRRLNRTAEQRLAERESRRIYYQQRQMQLNEAERSAQRERARELARQRRSNRQLNDAQTSAQRVRAAELAQRRHSGWTNTLLSPNANVASPSATVVCSPPNADSHLLHKEGCSTHCVTNGMPSDRANDNEFAAIMQSHLQAELQRLHATISPMSLDINRGSMSIVAPQNGYNRDVNMADALETDEVINVENEIEDDEAMNMEDHTEVDEDVNIANESEDDEGSDKPRVVLQLDDLTKTVHVGRCGIIRARRGTAAHHNSARNFSDQGNMSRLRIMSTVSCPHCTARLLPYETNQLCCMSGRITIPLLPPPDELLDLWTSQTEEGSHFRQNIRSYNHAFALTSMGVHIDNELATGRQGVYTYRAQGAIYHRIGDLHPQSGKRPRYLQMYIYDTAHEIQNRLIENTDVNVGIVRRLTAMLNRCNPFVSVFRQLSQRNDLQDIRLQIKEQPTYRPQYNLPSSSEVACILVGDDIEEINQRDIIVSTNSGRLLNVPDTAGFYDPLQYPLFHPWGNFGWDLHIFNNRAKRISCRAFYSYMLQMRNTYESLLLRGGRLLQQYVVDNYVKIATQQLRYIRDKQHIIRADLYQGLLDAVNAGETNAGEVGTRTILPPSYTGCPRDMQKRYRDAMALVQKYGRPDLFITMTCNPKWEEITSLLDYDQVATDRPDITTRVFRSKLEELKVDLFQKGVLGKVIAHVHVVEFQKRGLPHAHILLILAPGDKLNNPEDYDRVVRAEIPDPKREPDLYNIVLRHMIHGPCGELNPGCVCMKTGSCKKRFPKQFASETLQGSDSYPIYRRRDDGRSISYNNRTSIDNRWVVPYNPWLLKKYDCHLNVEICSSIKCVKYLYKYVYKGSDRISLHILSTTPTDNDEIRQFVDARWVCPQQACWRIFRFRTTQIYPSVVALQIHLPNMHQVTFYEGQNLQQVVEEERNSRTMLTEFFVTNSTDPRARHILYRDFPENYRWNKTSKHWERRKKQLKVVGRMHSVSPSEGERYYLRVLLNHVTGSTSFDDLLTVNSVTYGTFKQTAEQLGFLERDSAIRDTLLEASGSHMPSSLRRLFCTLLIFCEPTGVRALWDEFYPLMTEDYPSTSEGLHTNLLLHDMNSYLHQHKLHTSDYDLPLISDQIDVTNLSNLLTEELSVPVPHEDLESVRMLNSEQSLAFQEIVTSVTENKSAVYFIDGPGGTGKTFLYKAILAYLRSRNYIALATAASGVAATAMSGGRTAHSRFKIPIALTRTSTCHISKRSMLADLLRQASLIIWDEATMSSRYAFEALDRTMQDITGVSLPFGGKVVVLGDLAFSEYLLRVGNGTEAYVLDDMIKLPPEISFEWTNDRSLDTLVDAIFPQLQDRGSDKIYMAERAILSPKNEHVDIINQKVLDSFPGEERTYYSFDSVASDSRNLYQQEFLNSITLSGLPPHKLTLKVGSPIILLRNFDPRHGLCNGTRLVVKALHDNLIDAEISTGNFSGNRVFIHRFKLRPTENLQLPFHLIRNQFPVQLTFALTINKSQGQTLPHVGIYLPEHVFGHGQLYVALSRGVSRDTTKVLVKNGTLNNLEGTHTRNVVYEEIVQSCQITDDVSHQHT